MKFHPTILIKNLFTLGCYCLLVLILISYLEILIKNVNENPSYSSWNIIATTCDYTNGGN